MKNDLISVEEYTGLLAGELLSPRFAIFVKTLSDEILRCWHENKRVFVAGNGGSAATAAHFVNDLRKFVPGGLSAFCLSDNVPFMTAIANDESYEAIFRQSLVLDAVNGDLFVALSCSGTSPNIVSAIRTAGAIEMRIVLLTGGNGFGPRDVLKTETEKGRAIIFTHPDIRGQEDLMMILCHLAVGEVRCKMLEVSGE